MESNPGLAVSPVRKYVLIISLGRVRVLKIFFGQQLPLTDQNLVTYLSEQKTPLDKIQMRKVTLSGPERRESLRKKKKEGSIRSYKYCQAYMCQGRKGNNLRNKLYCDKLSCSSQKGVEGNQALGHIHYCWKRQSREKYCWRLGQSKAGEGGVLRRALQKYVSSPGQLVWQSSCPQYLYMSLIIISLVGYMAA